MEQMVTSQIIAIRQEKALEQDTSVTLLMINYQQDIGLVRIYGVKIVKNIYKRWTIDYKQETQGRLYLVIR